MSGPGNETLTAALRRLADERASGLLSVATPGRDVVIEVEDGTPVAIGPEHDVSDRVGADAPAPVATVAVVDELVDRLVAAIVTGDVDWTWGVTSDTSRTAVPAGLTQELARRAVDAAQALAALDPDDVLEPAHAVTTTGELDRVRRLFDGARTIEDVARAADLALPAVATMAAALVAGGALALDDEDEDDEPPAMSWTDTVAAADDEDDDEDDDEPELWVMDPPDEPEEAEDEDVAAPAVPTARERRLAATPLRDVGPPSEEAAEPPPEDEATPGEVEAPVVPAAAAQAATDEPAEEDEESGWNDTSWLDELSPTGADADAPPVLAAGDDDARAALGSMLSDLGDEELFGDRPSEDRDDSEPAAQDDSADPLPATRREPRAEPGDVAEFLRELSRLALDDD